jgi:hypothetical protein
MVLCQIWSDYHLAKVYWAVYFDIYRGQTPMWWRFGVPDSNLMRFPDTLVFQGGDW